MTKQNEAWPKRTLTNSLTSEVDPSFPVCPMGTPALLLIFKTRQIGKCLEEQYKLYRLVLKSPPPYLRHICGGEGR